MNLLLSIENLRNVGPRNISRLNRLGVKTVKDLLWHFPVRYEDYTETVFISQIEPGQKVNVQGEVLKISSKRLFPRRMTITNAIVGDSSGAVKVVWFNQPYIENQLIEGTLVSLAGKANLSKHGLYLSSPTYEKIGLPFGAKRLTSGLKHTHGLVPVYAETEGITSKYLRFLIKPLLKDIKLDDLLPPSIISKYNFPVLKEAIKTIHYPANQKQADLARERFAFEDLILFQLKALLERRKINQLKSVSVLFNQELIQNFILNLPFELTGDQKVALWEILRDLQKNYPMNRLMEGDVGSGKTVVALAAAYQVARQGYQTVLMAPTEVLARQHHRTITELLPDESSDMNHESRIGIGLLIGSEAKLNNQNIKKPELKKKIASGEIKIIIGTHAVIQKDITFKNLALVVIDEQHRFGINQRAALVKNSKSEILNPKLLRQTQGSEFIEGQIQNSKFKIQNLESESKTILPHLLSMTATPIPRTLALTIYGDLDISLIKEKPKNRQKIITRVIPPSQRKEAYQFIRSEVAKKKQVFVVCPRIESPELNSDSRPSPAISFRQKGSAQLKMNAIWAEVKAVEEEYQKLSQKIFPDLKIAMLHGRLKPKEKNEIMDRFKNKEFDILVSTSVIEVGVDVPNATIMAIESAERFGLAQLHQFRGRVGRDEYQSYCLLFSSTGEKSVNQRLRALVGCDDGFELAEKDMKIRGPGEFFGVKQSGMPDLGMASLANIDLIKKARAEARLLLKEDSSLSRYPPLKARLDEFQKMTHFE